MNKHIIIPIMISIGMITAFFYFSSGLSLIVTFVPGVILALIFYFLTIYKRQPEPKRILPLYLLSLGIQLIHFAEEYTTGFNSKFPELFDSPEYPLNTFVAFNMFAYSMFIFSVKYKCKVTNNSNKPVSITEYQAQKSGSENYKMYFDLSGKYIVDLPIKIDSYETKEFYLDLMYRLDSVKMDLLKENIPSLNAYRNSKLTKIPYDAVEEVLYNHQTDIFGNKVLKKGNNSYTIGEGKLNQEIHTVKLVTSSGNTFEEKVKFYPFIDEN